MPLKFDATPLLQRIESEASAEQERLLLTAAYVLMGLRLSRERAIELFRGVGKMRDSTTYQAILDEGAVMGQEKEARRILLRLGRKHLGEPGAAVEAAIQAIADLEHLELLAERVSEVASWQELLPVP